MNLTSPRRVVLVGALLTLVSAVVPAAIGLVPALIVSVGSIVLILRGAKQAIPEHRGPWRLFATAGALVLAGNLVRAVHGAIIGVTQPFPSPADGLFLLGYVAVAAGIIRLVRLRSADVEGDNILDALVLACGGGFLVLAYVLVPYAVDPKLGIIEKLLSCGYASLDLIVLGALGRLAVGSGRRPVSYRLLAAGLLSFVLADALATLSTAGLAPMQLSVACSLCSYVLFAAAAVHPSMPRVAERPADREIALTNGRLALLCLAFIAEPILAGIGALEGNRVAVGTMVVGSVVLAVLVLARLGGLARAKERKADREHLLQRIGAELVAAPAPADVRRSGLKALSDLAPDAVVVVLADVVDGCLQVAESVGPLRDPQPSRLDDASMETLTGGEVLCAPAASLFQGLPPDLVVAAAAMTRGGRLAGALVLVLRRSPGAELRRTLSALADLVALAIERSELSAELQRQRSEARFKALVEHSSELVLVIGADGCISYASSATNRLLGCAEETVVGLAPFAIVHADDRLVAMAHLDRAWIGAGADEPCEVRLRHASGAYRWFEIVASEFTNDDREPNLVLNARDVTERAEAHARLEQSEARFRSLVAHASDLVLVVDSGARITYTTPSFEPMLGRAPESMIGRSILDLVDDQDVDIFQSLLFRVQASHAEVELHFRHATGRMRTFIVSITDLRHDPAIAGFVMNADDVTERKMLELDLRHQALHDGLTGLANRALLRDRIVHTLERPNETAWILFIDLDEFKTVNDALGHTAGDAVLVSFAERLLESIRRQDTAARFGGDEFAVLVENVSTLAQVCRMADEILDALTEPILVQGHNVRLGASIGIAACQAGESADSVLQAADVAMYLAKGKGKGRYEVYEEGMARRAYKRLALRADLEQVLDREELEVVYQPIVTITTGQPVGMEALLRWKHPKRRAVSPVEFIPLAEETGAIVEIGKWVLDRALRDLATLRRHGNPSLWVSVNLSARQLAEATIVADVSAALGRHQLPGNALTLEVTESMVILEGQATSRLSSLRENGSRIGVDDFGTGYSSLSYLSRFPIDTLKIDRSFVRPLGRRPDGDNMAKAIIDMAAALQVDVVAEGVERGEQAMSLVALGCTTAQGFLFARPLPFDKLLEYLLRPMRSFSLDGASGGDAGTDIEIVPAIALPRLAGSQGDDGV